MTKSTAASALSIDQELSLGQELVRHLVFTKWELVPKNDYGCPITWLTHAISVC